MPSYADYLRLDELLSLQRPLSDGPEHDEMLFIVIHQVYELWFRQQLHELDHLREELVAGRTPEALSTFKRILTILKIMVAQIDVLETMTPVSFLSFRARLESGSGFQSVQFRELEFALGHRRSAALAHHRDTPGGAVLERRLREPSLYTCFLRYLARKDYPVPPELLEPDPLAAPAEDQRVRAILVGVYRRDPAAREVCERMVDLDEGIQEWRYRHVKMVERTIGTKPGTGGSSGAAYLRTTLFQALFPDLWSIRTEL